MKKLPDRPDRPSPFYVGWKVDGVRKKMGFKNAKDRDEKFRELEKAAKRGTLDLVPTRDDLRDWQAFKRATHPTRWQDVVAGWRESGQFSCTTTVRSGWDQRDCCPSIEALAFVTRPTMISRACLLRV